MPFDDEDNLPRLSPTSGAEPYASPYYNRAFWASYKGLSRGMLGGIVLGGAIGLGIGGVLAGGVLAYGLATGAAATMTGPALAAVAASTALGTKYGKDAFSTVGAVAGSNSTVMEINDQKTKLSDMKLDKLLEIEDRKGLMRPGELATLKKDIALLETQQDQYFEKKFTPRPFVFGKVAVVGAMAGLLFGAIAVAGGAALLTGHSIVELLPMLASGNAAALPAAAAAGLTIAGATLAGASYGINRDIFRRVFDVTNPLYDGDLSSLDRLRVMRARGVDPSVALSPRLQPVMRKAEPALAAETTEAVPGGFAAKIAPVDRSANFADRVIADASLATAGPIR